MADFTLIYARPRPAASGTGVIFERQRAHAECDDDFDAIRWALHDVPRDCGMPREPAIPMALWRLDAGLSRALVWESEPGIAWGTAS